MTTTVPLYQQIARALDAMLRCEKSGNPWAARWRNEIKALVHDKMPSGSGWDRGTSLAAHSTPDKLIFTGSFHHMDENGFYDGWTDHAIIVTPSLAHGFTLRVGGRDRNGIKDYLGDMFHAALSQPVEAYPPAPVPTTEQE